MMMIKSWWERVTVELFFVSLELTGGERTACAMAGFSVGRVGYVCRNWRTQMIAPLLLATSYLNLVMTYRGRQSAANCKTGSREAIARNRDMGSMSS